MSDIENTPLTKKGLPKSKNITIATISDVPNPEVEIIDSKTEIAAKIKKPRPPKTPLQMESFKKVLEKRKEILAENKKNKLIDASKVLVENNIKINQPKIKDEKEEEEEEEIVYKVIKKPKQKPKMERSKSKKIIKVYESSSESETDHDTSDESEDFQQWGRSTQNKKSKRKPMGKGMTVHTTPRSQFTNFFGN